MFTVEYKFLDRGGNVASYLCRQDTGNLFLVKRSEMAMCVNMEECGNARLTKSGQIRGSFPKRKLRIHDIVVYSDIDSDKECGIELYTRGLNLRQGHTIQLNCNILDTKGLSVYYIKTAEEWALYWGIRKCGLSVEGYPNLEKWWVSLQDHDVLVSVPFNYKNEILLDRFLCGKETLPAIQDLLNEYISEREYVLRSSLAEQRLEYLCSEDISEEQNKIYSEQTQRYVAELEHRLNDSGKRVLDGIGVADILSKYR